jgi:hypothetical protein
MEIDSILGTFLLLIFLGAGFIGGVNARDKAEHISTTVCSRSTGNLSGDGENVTWMETFNCTMVFSNTTYPRETICIRG